MDSQFGVVEENSAANQIKPRGLVLAVVNEGKLRLKLPPPTLLSTSVVHKAISCKKPAV